MRYKHSPFSPGRYGIWDSEAKDFVKNPATNRNRLYHSPERAQQEAEKLNRGCGSTGKDGIMICKACNHWFDDPKNRTTKYCLACREGSAAVRNFWTLPKQEQDATLLALPLEPGPPLTDEEKQEMEGCGA